MECLMLLYWQSMAAQFETRLGNAAKGGERRSLRLTWGGLATWSLIVSILAGCVSSVAVHAEENASLVGSSPSFAVTLNLTAISGSLLNARDHVRLAFNSRFNEGLKELAAEKELKNAPSKALLRKQLVWVDEPRTKLRPGFGEFFRGETVEPLRTSGVGMEDSRYLYVKFSFRF